MQIIPRCPNNSIGTFPSNGNRVAVNVALPNIMRLTLNYAFWREPRFLSPCIALPQKGIDRPSIFANTMFKRCPNDCPVRVGSEVTVT